MIPPSCSAEAQSGMKQSGSITPEFLGLGQSGVCGCFNQDKAGLKQDEDASIAISTKYSIEEILTEESSLQVWFSKLFLICKKSIINCFLTFSCITRKL